jgi:hypothetical protein
MKIQIENTTAAARHFAELEALSNGQNTGTAIYKALARLESKANREAVNYCNGDTSTEQWEQTAERITKQVEKLLPNLEPGKFFVNGDPRCYSLKLKEKSGLLSYRDWGGYEILAPQF